MIGRLQNPNNPTYNNVHFHIDSQKYGQYVLCTFETVRYKIRLDFYNRFCIIFLQVTYFV
jgi:hypothetical protein